MPAKGPSRWSCSSPRGRRVSDSISVRKLENNMGAISVTRAGYRGVSLYRLLEHYGIEIDAKTIVVKNAENKVEIPLSEAKKNADKILVISRTAKGKALSSKEGPLALRGSENLSGIESIELKTNAGQWNHSKGVYTKYLDQKIKISGTAVKKTRTYMIFSLMKLIGIFSIFRSVAGFICPMTYIHNITAATKEMTL